MYRTSSNDMGLLKSPVQNKNYAIPKYQGYIPGKDANSVFGGTYTAVTRKLFSPERLDTPSLFASTGFNWARLPKQDETLHASTHKYGKQTMQKPHPSINDKPWTTIARQSFTKPEERLRPNTKQSASCKNLLFDNTLKTSSRPATTASGFFVNRQEFDGTTWVPDKVLHTDMVRTEYRNRYNCAKPFHKTTLMASTGKLPLRTIVYDKY